MTSTCQHCGVAFRPTNGGQRYCEAHGCHTPAGRERERQRNREQKAKERAARPPDPDKQCPCGAVFPPEYNRLGQLTTRVFCDACRLVRGKHPRSSYLVDLPTDTPHCKSCDCVIGLACGGQTHVDADGNCPACVRWLSQVGVWASERAKERLEGFEPIRQWPVDKKAATSPGAAA